MEKLVDNLVDINSRHAEETAALLLACEQLKNENAKLSDTVAHQERMIKMLQKALFGQKSEKIIDEDERQGVFEDILREVDELNPSESPVATEEATEEKTWVKPRSKRRDLQELIPEDLPKEEIIIDLKDEEKLTSDGTELKRIGEDRVEKLAFKPGHYFRKIFIYPKYANPANALEKVKRAPAPDFAIPGGCFDESFYAHLIYSKYTMHLPYYRLEVEMKSMGLEFSRQTMSSSCIKVAKVLRPLVELMRQNIIKRNIIFTDETPVNQLSPGDGKTKKTYIWVYVGGGKGPPYRIYQFARKRNGDYPKKFLKDFAGYVHADAFSGYNALFKNNKITECACWMHVRRKFFEAEDVHPEVRRLVLQRIRNIYRYERAMKKLDRETHCDIILKVRNEKIRPLIDELFSMTALALTKGMVMPKSSFAGAITYMHNLGDALYTFLENPYLEPDNGESERALRPFCIGRKNWLFLGSKRGGEAAGTLMSLVQTCRVMKIDVREYIEDVLRRINGHPHSKLYELLPDNWQKSDAYYN